MANPLDNPVFWKLFLMKLSFLDPEHDAEIVADFCETFGVDAENVNARLRAVYMPGVH